MLKKLSFIWMSFMLSCQLGFSQTPTKKNVVLIVVDDLNDWIGACKGHPQTITPNLDKLASKAVVFNNTSCASPVCNPSRTAFLTGRSPHETGITNNADGSFRDDAQAWVRNLTSWPQYFGQQGFETVSQGKIFHTHNDAQGEFQTLGPGGQGCNAGSTVRSVPNTDLIWSESGQAFTSTGDYKSAQWCGNYLKQSHNKPFLLACGIFRPHLPQHAPKQFYDNLPSINNITLPPYLKNELADTYGRSNQSLPEVLKAGGETLWKETVRAYLANVSFADACIGKLLNDLENSAYKNNTIVVIVGDHGWHLGEKEHYQKFTMWDRAIKTPMLIYDPTVGGQGICNKAVSMMDIFPTLLDLTGTPTPSYDYRGRSIRKLVENPNADWCGAALTSYANIDHSVRTDRYRYIKFNSGKEELYDHETDPNEWTNVATKASYATVLADHRSILTKMLNNNVNPISNCGATGTTNKAPTVVLTSPVSSDVFEDPATITLNASATDLDGTISKVEFYNGTTLLGTDISSPYTYSFTNVAAGTYTLYAKAYDNQGAQASSGSVLITVNSKAISNISDLRVLAKGCQPKLLWTDVAGEDGYRIRRKLTSETVYTNIVDVAANSTSYIDVSTDTNTEYQYVVRPLSAGVAVANSNVVSFKTPACILTRTASNIDLDENYVFPNPTTGRVNLTKKQAWKLYSTTGIEILAGNSIELNIENQEAGIYFLELENKERIKLIKK